MLTHRATTSLVVAALALAACQSRQNAPARQFDSPPRDAGDSVSEAPRVRARSGALQRPDLGPEWSWTGQALPSGDPATSVLALEKIAPAEVNANAPYEYTIRVTNIARDVELADVVVSDRLPASPYAYESSVPAGEKSGDGIRWTVGRLAPGESKSFKVRGQATAVGRVMACASATWTTLVCSMTEVVSAALELTDTAPPEVIHCDDIPIRFVVRNPGTGAAKNVKVAVELPEGWTADGRRALTFDAGTLKAGASREFTATARASKTGSFVNRATATGDGGLSAKASAPTIVRRPKLEITDRAAIADQVVGRKTSFTIAVKNVGDAPARDTVLVEQIVGAERLECSDGGTVGEGRATWNLGTIAPGGSRTVAFTATRATDGRIADTATATAYCAEPVTATATTKYAGVPAVLLEAVDDPDPVVVGATTTYRITVTNQGFAPDNDVEVTCDFESFVDFVSATGTTTGTRDGSTIKFAPVARLDPKEAARWTVVMRGVKAGDSRFVVNLRTKETGGRPIVKSEATRIYE